MPLSSPAVSLSAVEATSLALWNEFLTGYFDGGTHAVNGAALAFPAASIAFQHNAPQKEGLVIHQTVLNPGKVREFSGFGTSRTSRSRFSWTFWIKCLLKTPVEGHTSESLCQLGSDRLFAILQDISSSAPLAQKGITALRPSLARIVSANEWSVRQIDVRSILLFDIN
jgi:hypothetical protein